MKYPKYPIKSSETFLQFEFFSEGPKGIIKKQVIYEQLENNPLIFNLAFGDVDANGNISDVVVTNNNDSHKVLATVVSTIYIFFEKHPDTYVFASGGSASRTRLYRIGISNNLYEIKADFDIFGYHANTWDHFKSGINHDAFLIKRKKQ